MEQVSRKIKVLFVDDDQTVVKIYRDGLARYGLEVETASDGLAAVQALRAAKPDIVVLDLMMPRFSGVDVLKFIRSQKDLAGLKIIMLSNSYMNELGSEAVMVGVQKALLKVMCTPSLLAGAIEDVAAGRESPDDLAHLLPIPKSEPPAPPAAPLPPSSVLPSSRNLPPPVPTSAPSPARARAAAAEFTEKAREDFLGKASATVAELRTLLEGVRQADSLEHNQALEVLYRKVHFLTATAGLAECYLIARMASAFEALLFELMEKPAFFGASVLQTMGATIDFFAVLFERAQESEPANAPPAFEALAVDDDPMSSRVIVGALRRADVNARSTQDPAAALQLAEKKHYDLILLDIEMPGMDGFEVCRRIRGLRGYQKTPVIYVTSHDDFNNRARSELTGGNDLISKPVFPIELAVKAVNYILKRQLDECSTSQLSSSDNQAAG